MLPLGSPSPPGFTNPIIFRASAALPAAGAWDAAPVEVESPGGSELTLVFSYTRGAAGGAFDFQIGTSIYSAVSTPPAGAAAWAQESLYQLGVLAAGADAQSRVQMEYQTYQATGAAQEAFVFTVKLSQSTERVRVRARESGVVGTPGTLQITGRII